eukprot:7386543-Prymnesium_polylepis.1
MAESVRWVTGLGAFAAAAFAAFASASAFASSSIRIVNKPIAFFFCAGSSPAGRPPTRIWPQPQASRFNNLPNLSMAPWAGGAACRAGGGGGAGASETLRALERARRFVDGQD